MPEAELFQVTLKLFCSFLFCFVSQKKKKKNGVIIHHRLHPPDDTYFDIYQQGGRHLSFFFLGKIVDIWSIWGVFSILDAS